MAKEPDGSKYISRVDAVRDGLVPPVEPSPDVYRPSPYYAPMPSTQSTSSSRLSSEVRRAVGDAHDDREVIEQVLVPGERILWAGHPDPAVNFTAADAFLIPFYGIWTGFVISFFVVGTQAPNGPGVPFLVVPSLFVLVGLYFLVGRFFIKAAMKRRTTYGVTDRRALIIAGRSLQESPIRNIQRTTKRARNGRHMTITFGQPWSFNPFFGRTNYIPNTGLDFFTFGRVRPVAFYDVADVDGLSAALAETNLAA